MDDLRHRQTPVGTDAEEFRSMGHQLVDRIAQHFQTLAARRVTSGEPPAVLQDLLKTNTPLPVQPSAGGPLLDEATAMLLAHSLFNAHPRFWGYITAGPTGIGVLSELLSAAVNANVGVWKLAPLATEIERQTIRWIGVYWLARRLRRPDGERRKYGEFYLLPCGPPCEGRLGRTPVGTGG